MALPVDVQELFARLGFASNGVRMLVTCLSCERPFMIDDVDPQMSGPTLVYDCPWCALVAVETQKSDDGRYLVRFGGEGRWHATE